MTTPAPTTPAPTTSGSGQFLTRKHVRQEAPDPEPLVALVNDLGYKPGWSLWLGHRDRGQGSAGLTLIITIRGRDTYRPDTDIAVSHYMIVPAAAYNERS
jgi:hypothetical protein